MQFISNIIPISTKAHRRTGLLLPYIKYIVMHGSGGSNFSAEAQRKWLTSSMNRLDVAMHIMIDDECAIECIPTRLPKIFIGSKRPCEIANHVPDDSGLANIESIGILASNLLNRKVYDNAVYTISKILLYTGLQPCSRDIRRHSDITSKRCPLEFEDDLIWEKFLNGVAIEYNIQKEGLYKDEHI